MHGTAPISSATIPIQSNDPTLSSDTVRYTVINDTNTINLYDGINKEKMIFTPLQDHFTPLHLACRVGNYQLVKRIIHFTDTHLVDNQAMPIHVAVMNNHSHIVQLIMDKMYAKYDQYNIDRKGYFSTFVQTIKSFFLGKEDSIESQLNTYKNNVTEHFKKSDSYKLATYRDHNGDNILHLACRYNCLDVVKRIVEHPMFYNYDIADYISGNDSQTKKSSTTYSNPIQIARMLEHTDIYQYLQQRMERHNHIHIVDILNRITDYSDKQKFIKYIMSDRYKFNKFERTLMDISSVNHDYIQNLSKFNHNPYGAMQFMPHATNNKPTPPG